MASESAKHDEATLNEKEKDEVLKEQERLRKAGMEPTESVRRASWLSATSGHDMARGSSVRRQSSVATLRPQ